MPPVVNMFAFGFGNLAMLGWLAAAAAPILIHLWMRHTHRDTPWAAMEFLREAIKRNARRLKLQQWLLLAVRTLVLLLLALAAAKPYLSGWNLLTGPPSVHRILVLDASMSTQMTSGEESHFDRAKRLAGEVLERGNAGDVYSIVVMADPPQVIIAGAVADARGASVQLANLKFTFGGAELDDTLREVEAVLSEAEANVSRREVLFFTDLAAHSWNAATRETVTAARFGRLAEAATVTVIDVGSSPAGNIAVHDLRIAGSLATTAEPLRLECNLSNHSLDSRVNTLLQLVADGVSIDEQLVALAAGGRATVSFDARLTEPGWQELSVRTTGNALAADDQVWLALDVPRRVRALLVEGTPGAARYLRHALKPGGGPSPIEPVVVPEGALVETPLEEFECIFLCNVARFTRSERTLLDRYAAGGGTLVFFLGDRVLPDTYNEVLANAAPSIGVPQPTSPAVYEYNPISTVGQSSSATRGNEIASLMPASIGALQSTQQFGLDPLDYHHPIAAAFKGSERAGLLSTPISKYYALDPSDGAEVALGGFPVATRSW